MVFPTFFFRFLFLCLNYLFSSFLFFSPFLNNLFAFAISLSVSRYVRQSVIKILAIKRKSLSHSNYLPFLLFIFSFFPHVSIFFIVFCFLLSPDIYFLNMLFILFFFASFLLYSLTFTSQLNTAAHRLRKGNSATGMYDSNPSRRECIISLKIAIPNFAII